MAILRRFLRLPVVVVVSIAAVAGIALVVSLATGGGESYRSELSKYLAAVVRHDVDGIRSHACMRVSARTETELNDLLAKLTIRLGEPPIRYDILRGERRTAYVDLWTQNRGPIQGRIPVVKENGRLLPCEPGDLLGVQPR